MSDAWPGGYPVVEKSLHESRFGRFVTTGVVALVVALVLGAAVWARFMTGVTAAPIPAGVTDAVPALTPPAAAAAATQIATANSRTRQPQVTIPAPPALATPTSTEPPVDGAWLDRTAAATGIPRRALQAYAAADLELIREQPACGLGWNTLAGIGEVESGHGRQLNDAGYSTLQILGPAVLGGTHAQGPMQFIPATWATWGADGNGDGVRDPNQIDDATLAAARYLCSYGSLNTKAGWRAAVYGYNHLDSYVDSVAAQASVYAQRAGS